MIFCLLCRGQFLLAFLPFSSSSSPLSLPCFFLAPPPPPLLPHIHTHTHTHTHRSHHKTLSTVPGLEKHTRNCPASQSPGESRTSASLLFKGVRIRDSPVAHTYTPHTHTPHTIHTHTYTHTPHTHTHHTLTHHTPYTHTHHTHTHTHTHTCVCT